MTLDHPKNPAFGHGFIARTCHLSEQGIDKAELALRLDRGYEQDSMPQFPPIYMLPEKYQRCKGAKSGYENNLRCSSALQI